MKIHGIKKKSKILLTPVKILDRQPLPKTLSSISRLQLFAKFYFNNFFQATFSRKGFFFQALLPSENSPHFACSKRPFIYF